VDKKSKSFTPKLYTGAIDKNGINIPSQQMEKYNNEWIMLEAHLMIKQELMLFKCL
jgi:hypothetical protein